MEVWFFGAAALITVIATCVHVFLGGRQFVRPLLATDLPPDLKWMAYFMWHVATVSVGATGVVFGLAATGHAGFGLFGVGFAAAIGLLGMGVAVKSGLGPGAFPIIFLNTLIVALGLTGVFLT